jgi:hypothetical protein
MKAIVEIEIDSFTEYTKKDFNEELKALIRNVKNNRALTDELEIPVVITIIKVEE